MPQHRHPPLDPLPPNTYRRYGDGLRELHLERHNLHRERRLHLCPRGCERLHAGRYPSPDDSQSYESWVHRDGLRQLHVDGRHRRDLLAVGNLLLFAHRRQRLYPGRYPLPHRVLLLFQRVRRHRLRKLHLGRPDVHRVRRPRMDLPRCPRRGQCRHPPPDD